MRPRYYNKRGDPIDDVVAWAKKLEDRAYCRVASTELPDGKWVSTVWLGLDHGHGGGPPLIFETMVFGGKNDTSDELDCERYSTEADALAGHDALVRKWETAVVGE